MSKTSFKINNCYYYKKTIAQPSHPVYAHLLFLLHPWPTVPAASNLSSIYICICISIYLYICICSCTTTSPPAPNISLIFGKLPHLTVLSIVHRLERSPFSLWPLSSHWTPVGKHHFHCWCQRGKGKQRFLVRIFFGIAKNFLGFFWHKRA